MVPNCRRDIELRHRRNLRSGAFAASAAKAAVDFEELAARLEPAPFQNGSRAEFFPQPVQAVAFPFRSHSNSITAREALLPPGGLGDADGGKKKLYKPQLT